jgi:hypothetical protein
MHFTVNIVLGGINKIEFIVILSIYWINVNCYILDIMSVLIDWRFRNKIIKYILDISMSPVHRYSTCLYIHK